MDGHGFCIARATRPSNPAPSSPPNRTFEETAKGIARAIVEGSEPIAGRSSRSKGHSRFGLIHTIQVRLLKHTRVACLERDLQDLEVNRSRSTNIWCPSVG